MFSRLETVSRRSPTCDLGGRVFLASRQRQDHTLQDHFCSVIGRFPAWNLEPTQTTLMSYTWTLEHEKNSGRGYCCGLDYWGSLHRCHQFSERVIAVLVFMALNARSVFLRRTRVDVAKNWAEQLQLYTLRIYRLFETLFNLDVLSDGFLVGGWLLFEHYSPCLPPVVHFCNQAAYLPDRDVNLDHKAGSSRMRPGHCTEIRLNPVITPNVGNSTV